MDLISRCYRAQMRLVRGSDELFWVRWYPACPGAEWYTDWTPFRSSVDRDASDPVPSLGEVRAACPDFVSCNFCPPPPKVCYRGDPDTFENGVRPEDLARATMSDRPCGSCAPRLAELIDRDPAEARYGWWQLYCDPASGGWVRGPAGTMRHRIGDDPAWELSGHLGLSVPGTVVWVYESCGVEPGSVRWVFTACEEMVAVEVLEDVPTVPLDGGAAYRARAAVAGLVGEAGSQEVTGAFDAGPSVLLVDLAARVGVDRSGYYLARRIGFHGGVAVYAARLDFLPRREDSLQVGDRDGSAALFSTGGGVLGTEGDADAPAVLTSSGPHLVEEAGDEDGAAALVTWGPDLVEEAGDEDGAAAATSYGPHLVEEAGDQDAAAAVMTTGGGGPGACATSGMGPSVFLVISGAGGGYDGTYSTGFFGTGASWPLPGSSLADLASLNCLGGGAPWKLTLSINSTNTDYTVPTSQTNPPSFNVVYHPTDFSAGGGSSTATCTIHN